MKRLWLALPVLAAYGQTPRPSDWLSAGGDAQRSGVEKADGQFTKASVKDFTVVLRHKLGAGETLMAPVVMGRLISYKGFKELAVVAGSGGHVWALDADLDRIFWERQLPGSGDADCGRVGMPAMMPAAETGPARNAARPIFVVAGDGKLYRLNPATGEDMGAPLAFVPARANAANLAVWDNVVYTETDGACGTARGAWSIDVESGVVGHKTLGAPPGTGAGTGDVSANGVVFRLGGSERAVLRAFDAVTGAELYSSGNSVQAQATGTGLSLANGRVYFTTRDGTLWAFGLAMNRD